MDLCVTNSYVPAQLSYPRSAGTAMLPNLFLRARTCGHKPFNKVHPMKSQSACP